MVRDKKRVVLTVTLALLVGLGHVATAAVTVPSFVRVYGAGIERGIARLVCEQRASESSLRVRAVVLDLGEPASGRDVLLAPAHGLPRETGRIKSDCRIDGIGGPPVGIAEFWLPEARNTGLGSDWIVLASRSALKEPVGRIRAGIVSETLLEQLVVDEWRVEIMLFTPAADQRDCRILGLLERRIFSHSCPGWAGLSGSPIVIGVDGEPVLIGIHVGNMIRPFENRGSSFRGVSLAIHDAIAAAIEQAAVHVRRHSAENAVDRPLHSIRPLYPRGHR